MKIINFLEFELRITQNYENLKIIIENHENHENLRIPCENHEHQANLKLYEGIMKIMKIL